MYVYEKSNILVYFVLSPSVFKEGSGESVRIHMHGCKMTLYVKVMPIHVMSHVSVSRNFWEPFLNIRGSFGKFLAWHYNSSMR